VRETLPFTSGGLLDALLERRTTANARFFEAEAERIGGR